MECRGQVPFEMYVDGVVAEHKFFLKGEGVGNGEEGKMEGEFTCETGRLPLAWPALAQTLGYGTKVFVQYPSGIVDFFKQCMPQGYTQERIIKFENDGTLHGFHTITMERGRIINKVTVKGTGFRRDSPVLSRNLEMMKPSIEYTFPIENGIKSTVHHVFPLKDRSGFIVADQTTICKALGEQHVHLPTYHHTKLQVKQEFVPTTGHPKKENVLQRDIAIAYPVTSRMKVF